MAITLNDFEPSELIDNLFEREEGRNILNLYLQKYRLDEIMEEVKCEHSTNHILKELDEDKIVDYISDEYFIAEDEDDAVKILRDGDYIEDRFDNNNPTVSTFRKEDCLDILERITEKEGWNGIYDILLLEKDKLHIL